MSEPEATSSAPPNISEIEIKHLKTYIQRRIPELAQREKVAGIRHNKWFTCRVGPCAMDSDLQLRAGRKFKRHLEKNHEIDFDNLSRCNARMFRMLVLYQKTEGEPHKTSVLPLVLKLMKKYGSTKRVVDDCFVCTLEKCNRDFPAKQRLMNEMEKHQQDVHSEEDSTKHKSLLLLIIYKSENTVRIRQEDFPSEAKPVEELGSSDMDISPEDTPETKSSEKRRRSASPEVYQEKDPPKSSYAGPKRTKIEERPTGLQIPTRLEFPTNVLPGEKSEVCQKASAPLHARPKPSLTIVKPIEAEKPTDSSSTKSDQRPKSGEWKQFTRFELLEIPLPPSAEAKLKDKPRDESKLAPPKISPQKPAVTLKCQSCTCEHQIVTDCRCHGQAVSSNNFICGYCPTSKGPDVSTGDMQPSMQAIEKLTTCRLCREKTGDLKNHLKQKHYLEIGKCYECIPCNDRFVNISELKSHKDKYCPYRK